MALPARIETERLVLRPPQVDDAADLHREYASDPEVVRYLTWRPHDSEEATRAYLQGRLSQPDDGSRPYVITIKPDNRLAGMMEGRREGHALGIGYVLARPHWGQGYMAEAVRALVDAAFEDQSIRRAYAYTDVDNRRSARVLEKAGFTREGTLHRLMLHPNISDEPRDCYLYAVWR